MLYVGEKEHSRATLLYIQLVKIAKTPKKSVA